MKTKEELQIEKRRIYASLNAYDDFERINLSVNTISDTEDKLIYLSMLHTLLEKKLNSSFPSYLKNIKNNAT